MSPRPLTQIKHFTDGLVVRWVTTSESPLLYVFAIFVELELVRGILAAQTYWMRKTAFSGGSI
jgi:hypothetical protein